MRRVTLAEFVRISQKRDISIDNPHMLVLYEQQKQCMVHSHLLLLLSQIYTKLQILLLV